MRKQLVFEGEPLDHSELCIRVMEALLARVEHDPRFDDLYIDLYAMYADVLTVELGPYAFHLAVELFTTQAVVVERRLARAKRQHAALKRRARRAPIVAAVRRLQRLRDRADRRRATARQS